jgi:RimJ/RimL family protein N-acetyltransferase
MTTELIQTPRLDLCLIAVDDLIQLYESPENFSLPIQADYKNTYRVLLNNPGPLRWRVPQVKHDATLNKWFVRFIVLRDAKEIIGSISFHGEPDSNGMIEIGLEITTAFQNQGYATEALQAMWSWACTQPGVSTLRYTVSPNNAPSQQIIQKFGFTHVGVQIDEEDGPEDIFEMSAAEFLGLHSPEKDESS